MTVAIDRGKDRNGNDMGADFPNVVVFGKQAENCGRYLAKGARVAIEGRLQTGSYDRNGEKVHTTDVMCSRVEFIDFADKTAQNENQSVSEGYGQQGRFEQQFGNNGQFPQQGFQPVEEDIPF